VVLENVRGGVAAAPDCRCDGSEGGNKKTRLAAGPWNEKEKFADLID
jgi:hypothetical protein